MTVEAAPASQSEAIARLEAALATGQRHLGRGLAWIARAGWPGAWAGLGSLLFLLLAHASRAGLYLFGAFGLIALVLAFAALLGSARRSRRARRLHQAGASARAEAIVTMAVAQRSLFVGLSWLCVATGIGVAVVFRHLMGQSPGGHLVAGMTAGIGLAALAGTLSVPRGQMWFIAAGQAPLHLRPGWDAERYAFDGAERLERSIGAADRRLLSALAMADARQGQGVVPRLPFGPWPGRRLWGELAVRGRGAVGYAVIGAIAALLAFFLATATPLGSLTRTAFSGLDALLQPDPPQPESDAPNPDGGKGQQGSQGQGQGNQQGSQGQGQGSQQGSQGQGQGDRQGSQGQGKGSQQGSQGQGQGNQHGSQGQGQGDQQGSQGQGQGNQQGSQGQGQDDQQEGQGNQQGSQGQGQGDQQGGQGQGQGNQQGSQGQGQGDQQGSQGQGQGDQQGSQGQGQGDQQGSQGQGQGNQQGSQGLGQGDQQGSHGQGQGDQQGSQGQGQGSQQGSQGQGQGNQQGSQGPNSSQTQGSASGAQPSDDQGSPGTQNGPGNGADPSGPASADQVTVSPTDTDGNGTVSQVSATPGPLTADRGAAPAEALDVVVQQTGQPAKPHDHKPQQIVPVWMQQIIGGRPDQE